MSALADKGVLFFYSCMGFCLGELKDIHIFACMAAVVIACMNDAFPYSPFRAFTCLSYALACCFQPAFLLFLPLVSYDYAAARSLARFLDRNTPQGQSSFRPKQPFQRPPRGFFAEKHRCLQRLFDSQRFSAACSAFLYFVSVYALLQSRRQPVRLCFSGFGCFLALLLHLSTVRHERLRRLYRQTRDDDTQRQLLLKERNQNLLEKQNSEIYAATLRERNRIAREIHDNVGHMLTRSILMVGALRVVSGNSGLEKPLEQLEDTLNQAMDSIRQSVHDLHDQSVNLEEALKALVRDFTFCPVTLQYDMSPELPREVKYSFISIAKEALVNISRHSRASAASITAVEHPGFYQYIIKDNGKGNDAEEQTGAPRGIGLENIQSRVDSLRGHLELQTKNGFQIYITVPKGHGLGGKENENRFD